MGNRRSLLSAILALVVLVPAFTGGSLASAGHKKRKHCSGTARLSEGIYYPAIAVKTNVSFSITASCVDGGSVSGDGILSSASCGDANGSVTIDGESYGITVVGTTYVMSHGLLEAGNGQVVPHALNGESCSTGSGADAFLVVGSICAEWHTGGACLH